MEMSDELLHSPQWLRNEAERCFRLAQNLMGQKDHDALVDYGRELQERAGRVESALKGIKP